MINLYQSMGVLRCMLHGFAFLLILILPFSEPSWNPEGASLILGAVIPAIAPIVAIVIMMDVMMCKIAQADSQDDDNRIKYRNISRANIFVAVILSLSWLNSFSGVLL